MNNIFNTPPMKVGPPLMKIGHTDKNHARFMLFRTMARLKLMTRLSPHEELLLAGRYYIGGQNI